MRSSSTTASRSSPRRFPRTPRAVAKATDPEFAAQVLAAVKHYGKIPTMEEALDFVLKEQRDAVDAVAEARREREMAEWDVTSKDRKDAYRQFAEYRDTNVQRASDMRNPAPNGHFLRLYGQSDREIVENGNTDASVMQALTMMNGTLFRNLISPFSRHHPRSARGQDARMKWWTPST